MAGSLLIENVLASGHRIACGVHGSGTPVVLLHGTPSHSLIWRDVAPHLAAAGMSVHCYDLLGFGMSGRPVDADTSVTAQAGLLGELLDLWHLDAPHLVDHDIGGAIALRHAVFRPHRLASLTLIDTVSYDSWPSETWQRIIEKHVYQGEFLSNEDMRSLMERQLRMTVHRPERMPEAIFEDYVRAVTGPIGQPSFFEHQARHYDSRHTMEVAGRLGEISVPTQVIWGERDRWQPVDYARRLAEDIPGARRHVIPEAGHFLMEDDPVAVAELVTSFVREAENASS